MAGFEAKFRENYGATSGAWGGLVLCKNWASNFANYRFWVLRPTCKPYENHEKIDNSNIKTQDDFSDSLTALSLVYLLAALEHGPSLSFLQSYSAYRYSTGFLPLFLTR